MRIFIHIIDTNRLVCGNEILKRGVENHIYLQ